MYSYLKKLAGFITTINRLSIIRLSFIILLLLLVGVNLHIQKNVFEDPDLFSKILVLLVKVLSVSMLLIILFSFLSSYLTYFSYTKQVARQDYIPQIRFYYPDSEVSSEVIVEVECETSRPWGGAVKIVLEYDQAYRTRKFALWKSEKRRNNFLAKTKMIGRFVLELPEVRHYELHGIVVLFEDAFHLFSFNKVQDVKGRFTILPVSGELNAPEAVPMQAREQVKRTESLRRQEGEWLHFKSFEPSDDTRRIVWQIYARSKELVIRLPEIQNMYASRIDVYSSFYNIFRDTIEAKYFNPLFLTDYKQKIWGFIQSLQAKSDELEVCCIPDQTINIDNDEQLPISLLQLAAMNWHTDSKPSDYFDLRHTSVCCISSLTPTDDLELMIKQLSSTTLIVFVPFSKMFKVNNWKDVPQDIFMEPNKAKGEVSRWRWWSSSFRFRLLKNESAIRLLFQAHENFFEI